MLVNAAEQQKAVLCVSLLGEIQLLEEQKEYFESYSKIFVLLFLLVHLLLFRVFLLVFLVIHISSSYRLSDNILIFSTPATES